MTKSEWETPAYSGQQPVRVLSAFGGNAILHIAFVFCRSVVIRH